MSYIVVAIIAFVAGAILINPENRKKIADILDSTFSKKG